MICATCQGAGVYWNTLLSENRPCPDCIGGVAYCCEGTPAAVAVAAYRDDSFEARACDHCGRSYRGPAVYCSHECALADA